MYYQHAADRCAAYGRPGHNVQQRTILVGYTCSEHSPISAGYSTTSRLVRSSNPRKTSIVGDQIRSAGSDPPLTTCSQRGLLDDDDGLSASLAPDGTVVTFNKHLATGSKTDKIQAAGGRAYSSISKRLKKRREEFSDNYLGESLRNEGSSTVVELTAPNPPRRLERQIGSESIHNDSDNGKAIWNQDDTWDSDKSDLSEAESVISTTSSATTVDIDALEVIFRRLLQHHELRYLWPQVVRRSHSRQKSLRNIERFLRRYAEDLYNLATRDASEESSNKTTKQVQVDACRFLRKSRLNLTQRIVEAHCQLCQTDNLPDEAGDQPTRQQVDAADESDDSMDDSSFDPIYIVAESFLFETEPIIYLAANVKAFIKLRRPKQAKYMFGNSVKLYFENLITNICKPAIMDGKKRATWTCVSTCHKSGLSRVTADRPAELTEHP